MLILQDMIWQLTRNKGRTVILLLASAMLAGCMAFYLGNIRANQEALERLAAVTEIPVDVTCGSGAMSSGLNITPQSKDNFLQSPYLENFLYGVRAVGAYSDEARRDDPKNPADPFEGFGDVDISCLNDLAAIYSPDYVFDFAEGYDVSFLSGDQPQAVVLDTFAEKHGIEPGDELTFPIYMHIYADAGAIEYSLIGDLTLTVIGLYHSDAYPKTMLVPADWLRKEADARGARFYYNNVGATLKDPLQLNQFKQSIPDLPFLEPNPASYDEHGGATICVDDEQYINAAETLGQNIVLFQRFQIPFFCMVIGLVVLAIFLIMRGSRRDMAISCSLGRSKFLCALSCFLAALLAEVAGCVLVFPAMVFLAGVSTVGSMMICGAFLLCACLGDVLALALILRFDAFTLLTAAE